MGSISVPTAIIGAGALSAGSSLASGLAGASAASDAADLQYQAAQQAQANTMTMFNKTQANFAPYLAAGNAALPQLQQLIGAQPGGNTLTAPLTKPFQPTMAQLAATPGYQFTLGQGLEATQNGFAAQGLGASGAAIKGAAQYAEGLAGTTYQQQFGNYLAQNQQIYNMLGGITGSGQNAAGTLGSQGLSANSQANSALIGGANAAAAGIIGSNNALFSGINNAASGLGNAGLLYSLNQNQSGVGADPYIYSGAGAANSSTGFANPGGV